jgi:hypothetical protein
VLRASPPLKNVTKQEFCESDTWMCPKRFFKGGLALNMLDSISGLNYDL